MAHTFYSSKEWYELLNKKENKMELKVGNKYISPDNKVVTITAIGKDNVLYTYDMLTGYERHSSRYSFIETFTKPKKKVTKWTNLYPSISISGYTCYGYLYESEAEAKRNESHKVSIQVKIEFEDDQN